MTATPRDEAGPNRPGDLNESDRILLQALRAWGVPSRLWDRLEPAWGARLRAAWDRGLVATGPGAREPSSARADLGRDHRAAARVDPVRVHPSWWVRALREEAPSVRRIVVAAAPESVRNAVQTGLLLDNDDLRTDRAPDPEALAWVMSLWSERLVGGGPDRADDPPAIVALSRISPRAGYRLCRCAGIAKFVLAGQAAIAHDTTPTGRARAEWFRDRLAFAGPEFGAVARHDVKSFQAAKLSRRRRTARLGLLTIARLLTECEPFRVRWALQHWPYTIAKLTRSLMTVDAKRSSVVAQVESQVLKTAWDRLNLEERLRMAWPGKD
jgi:hypothetical protein